MTTLNKREPSGGVPLFVAIGLGLVAQHGALVRARFVQNPFEQAPNSGLAQRTAIGSLRRGQNLAFSVGLIERRSVFVLYPSDLQDTFRAFVQQFPQLVVEPIDFT